MSVLDSKLPDRDDLERLKKSRAHRGLRHLTAHKSNRCFTFALKCNAEYFLPHKRKMSRTLVSVRINRDLA